MVRLQEGDQVLDEKNIYFVYHKDLDLPTPHFSVQAGEENDEKFIQVSSDKLACNVMFCIPGESAFFSDNYIDIIPGRNYKIKVDTDLSPTQIQERIKYENSLTTCQGVFFFHGFSEAINTYFCIS